MKIKIKGISEEIIIGCYEHEKNQLQPIIVDLECSLFKYNWFQADRLETTVNYDELINFVRGLLPEPKYNLLESMAQYIAGEVLQQFSLIRKIKICLTKPALFGINAQEIKVCYTHTRKFKVALALGSNHVYLPQQQVITAIELLGEYIEDITIGGFYKTLPVGIIDQNNFINTAISGFTKLSPDKLLGKIKTIEKLMGKEETQINGPRIIDIDLIFFDDLTYVQNFLQIPHKEMHNRDFVLAPLVDIAADWVHPILNESVKDLNDKLQSTNTNIIGKVEYYK
jgi:dihydroneopterin aldolase/2-amino-4-hydroxy-6-hydroxymethyldihydropteridine diphosphokinase